MRAVAANGNGKPNIQCILNVAHEDIEPEAHKFGRLLEFRVQGSEVYGFRVGKLQVG